MNEVVQLILSIITGVYSGIIVAKYSEFITLREESNRVLQKGGTAKDCGFELRLISNSLKRLGHSNSAQKLSKISDDFMRLSKSTKLTNGEMTAGSITLPSMEEVMRINDEYHQLRTRVANLKPSWFYIIFPFYKSNGLISQR